MREKNGYYIQVKPPQCFTAICSPVSFIQTAKIWRGYKSLDERKKSYYHKRLMVEGEMQKF